MEPPYLPEQPTNKQLRNACYGEEAIMEAQINFTFLSFKRYTSGFYSTNTEVRMKEPCSGYAPFIINELNSLLSRSDDTKRLLTSNYYVEKKETRVGSWEYYREAVRDSCQKIRQGCSTKNRPQKVMFNSNLFTQNQS